jgi:DNA ligase 1
MSIFCQFLEMIEDLALVSSRADKMSILQESDSPEMRSLLTLTLDSNELFFVRNLPDGLIHTQGVFPPDTESFVGFLMDLKYNRKDSKGYLTSFLEQYDESVSKVTQVILNKELKCGVKVKTAEKALSMGLEEFRVMKGGSITKDGEVDFSGIVFPCIAEIKYDGFRSSTIVDWDANDVTFLSTSGKPLANCVKIAETLLSDECKKLVQDNLGTRPVVFDAELVAKNGSFRESQKHLSRDEDYTGDEFELVVFTVLLYDDWITSLEEPRSTITPISSHQVSILSAIKNAGFDFLKSVRRIKALDQSRVQEYMQSVINAGHEGLMIKNLDQPYDRRRVKGWMKWKFEDFYDCTITGFAEGEGKHRDKLGAFICDFNGVEVSVGGSYKKSLDDNNRTFYWENKEGYMDGVIKVIACGVTPDGSLRHPRFVEFHEEK